MSVLWELKKRNIFKVAFAYVIFAWLFIQIGSMVFSALLLPDWIVPFIIVLLIVAFPFVIFLAWINANPVYPETGQAAVRENVEDAKKTIAVLPFTDLSPDPGQEYFVDGLSEELLNSLTKIPGLLVTARTSSFAFKRSDKKVQEIAKELGVDHILEGSVRKDGNTLRITAQLVRASDGFYLWSKTYDRELKDIFAVQEDIANAVANELKATLGIDRRCLSIGCTDNVEAYELYLFAQGQRNEGTHDAMIRALKSIDAALALHPEFALAWSRKAVIHNFLPDYISYNRIAAERDAGLKAAMRAIELEPNLAAGYASLGHNRTSRGQWIDAELAYRKAFELATEPIADIMAAVPLHYLAVGYFKKAHDLLEVIRREDPFNNPNRAFYMMNFALLGDKQRAEEEFEHGRVLFGDQWFWGNIFITLLRLGDENPLPNKDISLSKNSAISDAAKRHLKSPKDGLEELRRFYADEDNQNTNTLSVIALWAAYFGDPEFAMDATEKLVSLDAINIFFTWLPVMKDVRQTLRFKEFVKKIGLVDYWNKFGWPEICHQLDNGDFECD